MAYTKQTWATGDVVTSAKLNHMEDGIAGADAISETFYVVPGDYGDGEELPAEEYSRLAGVVYGNGGAVMISVTEHPAFIGNVFGFWNCLGEELEIDDATHVITVIPAGNGGNA